MSGQADVVIRGGLIFNGTGGSPIVGDVAIRDGHIIATGPNLAHLAGRQIDAKGHWVMPGLLDIHTHLDLEVELNPGLDEVVRHGTTSVVVGNCSIGTAFGSQRAGNQDPIVDCFARVENIPKKVLSRCADKLNWDNTADYLRHFEEIPLGPNVAPLVPHSMLRISVMGVDEAVRRNPTRTETDAMQGILREAMQQGYVGFSTDGLPFHYLANNPNKKMKIPTQYADFSELKSLLNIVRNYDRVWQTTPDSHDRLKTLRWFLLTSGRLYGKPLRTSALTAIDTVADRSAWRMFLRLARFFNSRLVNGKFHFQVLSTPFKMWGDGVTTPAFEELPATAQLIACELDDITARRKLLTDPAFAADFDAQWESDVGGLSLIRDLNTMFVEKAPVSHWSGMTFAAIKQRLRRWQLDDQSVSDITAAESEFFKNCPNPIGGDGEFMRALLTEFDRALRWWAVAANDRPEIVKELLFDPNTLPGFNDSGAHLTNLAFFDANLVSLKIAQQHDRVPEMVKRLTSDPAQFFRLDVGRLDVGSQADITIIDPEKLKQHDTEANRTWIYRDIFEHEQLVNRSDGVVTRTLIAGETVWDASLEAPSITPLLGTRKLGRALTAREHGA